MRFHKMHSFLAGVVAVFAMCAGPVAAIPLNLSDGNSTVRLNTTYGSTNWLIDGVDHLFYDTFYYRIVTPAGGSGLLREVGGDGFQGTGITCSIASCSINYVLFQYGSLTVTHTLLGGTAGSETASWSTDLAFTRATGNLNTLNFYAYADYDLGATPSGDNVEYQGGGLFIQEENHRKLLWQSSTSPTYCTARAWNGNADDAWGNLNNSCSYSGDAIFMAQWVNPAAFSIDRTILVPEPASLLLLGAGLVGLVTASRRREAR